MEGGGGSLYHCVTSGGGGIVCTSLYKMWEGGSYDVHNCGGERGRFCVSWGVGSFYLRICRGGGVNCTSGPPYYGVDFTLKASALPPPVCAIEMNKAQLT